MKQQHHSAGVKARHLFQEHRSLQFVIDASGRVQVAERFPAPPRGKLAGPARRDDNWAWHPERPFIDRLGAAA